MLKVLNVSIPSNGSIQFLHLSGEFDLPKEFSVSIPSNGSIQFLHLKLVPSISLRVLKSLNPLKRVNSILTRISREGGVILLKSQSPQTGQFNSYDSCICPHTRQKGQGLNPLKRVNSILTRSREYRSDTR